MATAAFFSYSFSLAESSALWKSPPRHRRRPRRLGPVSYFLLGRGRWVAFCSSWQSWWRLHCLATTRRRPVQGWGEIVFSSWASPAVDRLRHLCVVGQLCHWLQKTFDVSLKWNLSLSRWRAEAHVFLMLMVQQMIHHFLDLGAPGFFEICWGAAAVSSSSSSSKYAAES